MPLVYTGDDGFATQMDNDSLALGDEVMPRTFGMMSSTTITMTSQLLRLTMFTARKTQTSTQVRVATGATAAGATPTIARIGLYLFGTVLGVDTWTLVASTANDTALFAAASTAYTKSWSTPYVERSGSRYALATLVVTGATAPTMSGMIGVATEFGLAPRMCGSVAAQADLPATVVASTVADNAGRVYGVILP